MMGPQESFRYQIIRRIYIFLAAEIVLVFFLAGKVDAVIYEIGAISAKSSGMMSALVATADTPIESLYYNPATVSQVKGTGISAGMEFINFPVRYKSLEGYKDTSNTRPLVPYFAFTTEEFAPFFFGIGTYSSFGIGFDFEKDPAHKVYGGMKSLIGTLTLNPTLAYQINSRLFLGIQANIGYGKAEIDLPVLRKGLKTDSDGSGFGGTIGLLYKPTPSLDIGLKWRSPVQYTLEGDAELSDGKKDDMRLYLYYPQAIFLGIGYRLKDNLTLEIDYTWYQWSHFKHSRFSYDTWHLFNTHLNEGMKDCYRINLGGEYILKNNLALWFGYMFNPSATHDSWISPIGPDITNHSVTTGLGIGFGDFEVDLAFVYSFIPDKEISSDESKTGFPGEYESEFSVLVIGVTYSF